MDKKTEKKNENFPIELPSRNSETKRSPIVDVTENEIFPMGFNPSSPSYRQNSGVQGTGDISEVVATEIEPGME